jgi:predicted GNAT family N-acyltransferase
MPTKFNVAVLPQDIDRKTFCSGSLALDQYFHTQVGQDIKRRVTACFVATDANGTLAGYYTLASASVMLNDLPKDQARKLPRYPSIPAIRMGRLAVGQAFKGQGLGAALLGNALLKAASSEIVAYALLVDAKDASAAAFYAHHGFVAFPNQTLSLFLPLATVKGL